MKYLIDEQELKELVNDALKFRALVAWNIGEWGNYYDALSDNFDTPREDYDDYTEIVANYIESNKNIGKVEN